jgi:hypothetical protein
MSGIEWKTYARGKRKKIRGEVSMAEIRKLVQQAIENMQGDRNPYRIASYISNMLDVHYFGMMFDIREALNEPPEANSLTEQLNRLLRDGYESH